MKEIKRFIKSVLEELPFCQFFVRMYYFIKSPRMLDGEWESSPLKLAGKNYFISLFAVFTLVTAANYLFNSGDIFPFASIINPIHFSIVLFTEVAIFSITFWAFLTGVTCFKSRGVHKTYFLQVFQTYAILNFVVAFSMWVLVNDSITKTITGKETSGLTLILMGVLAFISFLFLIWLLVAPTADYLQTYYSKKVSWLFVLIALAIAMTSKGNIDLYFSEDYIIDKPKFCEYLFHIKSMEDVSLLENRSCIIGKCILGDK
ncbi:hypothetical protein FXE51_20310 [Vibrio mimicus]|uniref:hypothetical protein n=1 Tax=Vibrio mimicus TaxID=674 RepID=UPI0011D62E65|nr:hypothetical protein [Vibrio mimicus]TXZ73499.1 hypothetical protein FXE51_20310 [Vibrio mimicus]